MFNSTSLALGKKRSTIRELFEYGKRRAAEIGRENIFDFSLGNPSVPAPAEVNAAIKAITDTTDSVALHGYTSAQGDAEVRKTLADDLNARFDAQMNADCLYMTCGAASSLSCCLRALCEEGDEFIAFTPFFPEYRVFTEAAGGKLVTVASLDGSFQLDLPALERALTPRTKAVIVNSPNNPSGVVLNKESIDGLCAVLTKKSEAYAHPIFLIADEPYRELVYDGQDVPYLTKKYAYTFVCYSFSKSMSLPGERIGYVAVSPTMPCFADAYAAICGAGRALGYVCAPSLMQRVVASCIGKVSDVSVYRRNRDLLYHSLTDMGYTCVYPDGAFYLFVKSPVPDATAFCEKAKEFELLLVPSDDFGSPGYVRIAYCVSTDLIERALPAFKKLIESYR